MIPSTYPDQTPPSTRLRGQHAHRPLSDEVLQSAEEAVSSEGADDYAGLSRGDYVARTEGVQSPYTGRVTSTLEEADAVGAAEGSAVSRLTRYVQAEPAKAAMMAAGAGALLAILMGRRKGGRRQ